MIWRTFSPLWQLKLSITMICPGSKAGASTCSTYCSKTAVIVAPSMMRHSPIPCHESEAIKVVFFPRFRGTDPMARCPFSAKSEISCGKLDHIAGIYRLPRLHSFPVLRAFPTNYRLIPSQGLLFSRNRWIDNPNIYGNKYGQLEYLWNRWPDVFGIKLSVTLACA
jgi:hypothetical protein